MPIVIEKIPGTLFLAYPERKLELLSELRYRLKTEILQYKQYGDLFYFENVTEKIKPFWSKATSYNVSKINFSSISEAAGALKNIQRNWAGYHFTNYRRAALIQKKLPYINTKPKDFIFDIPDSPMGFWTLINENTIFASVETSTKLPAGNIEFVEDHEQPPSRAYLKFMEAITMMKSHFGVAPEKNEFCFDAGACPGGWSWVLTQIGCRIFAVDRAELAEDLMKNPLVKFKAHDAFTYKPSQLMLFDWVFSDVICYPTRLYDWVCMWLEEENPPNMICTIKMQGETDWELIDKFAAIPDSIVLHMNYNKHELTWMHYSHKKRDSKEADSISSWQKLSKL